MDLIPGTRRVTIIARNGQKHILDRYDVFHKSHILENGMLAGPKSTYENTVFDLSHHDPTAVMATAHFIAHDEIPFPPKGAAELEYFARAHALADACDMTGLMDRAEKLFACFLPDARPEDFFAAVRVLYEDGEEGAGRAKGGLREVVAYSAAAEYEYLRGLPHDAFGVLRDDLPGFGKDVRTVLERHGGVVLRPGKYMCAGAGGRMHKVEVGSSRERPGKTTCCPTCGKERANEDWRANMVGNATSTSYFLKA